MPTLTSVTKYFPSAKEGFTTTLASTIASGATTVPLNSITGYTNGDTIVLVVDPTNTTKKQAFTGVVDTSGVQLTGVVWTEGTNQQHDTGATVVDYVTATHMAMTTKGILVEHGTDGTHKNTIVGLLAGTQTFTGKKTFSGGIVPSTVDQGWDGWFGATDTWTYASATTFTIAGVDRTATFPVGTKIKLTQTTAKYFYVVSSSFSTNTTVTITGGTDYTLANAAITLPFYSYASTPQSFPQWFSYAPTWAGVTADFTTVSRFCVRGRACLVEITRSDSKTSNAATMTATLPITARTFTNAAWRGFGSRGVDNGVAYNVTPFIEVLTGATVMNIYSGPQPGVWTASGLKGADVTIEYEI